jgi:hypothetical protein
MKRPHAYHARTNLITHMALAPAFIAVLLLSATASPGNLLLNPGFELNNGHTVPLNWTRFAPPTAQAFGNYWVDRVVTPHSGSFYFKEWGACYNGTNNVAGLEHDFAAAPGSIYQASGWFYTSSGDPLGSDCYTWIEVAFLGSTSNVLSLYKSANFSFATGTDAWAQLSVTNACNPLMPVSVGDPYFTTCAVTGSVSQLVAPVGTTTVRFRYAYLQFGSEGGSSYFDDAALTLIPEPLSFVLLGVGAAAFLMKLRRTA